MQVKAKSVGEASHEVQDIYREMLSEFHHASGQVAAILTLATVIHMNAHPIYIVDKSDVDESFLAIHPEGL